MCEGSIEGTLRWQIHRRIYLLINIQEIFHPIYPLFFEPSPSIDFQENFQPPSFSPTIFFSTLPDVIRAYPLIKFEEKFQSTLLLEPPLVLET